MSAPISNTSAFQMDVNSLKASVLASKSRSLVRITTKTTVKEALMLLYSNNILSVPVYDEDESRFIGILALLDIMAYVAFGLTEMGTFEDRDITFSLFAEERFSLKPAHELLGLTPEGRSEDSPVPIVHIFDEEARVMKVLHKFSTGQNHRVLVDFGRRLFVLPWHVYRVASQTDALAFIAHYRRRHHYVVHGSLAELGLIDRNQQLLSVPDSTQTVKAFRTMLEHNISSLLILRENGSVFGTLSTSDLRHITEVSLPTLLLPVETFIKHVRHSGGTSYVWWPTERASLADIIDYMVRYRHHRVWVVDDTEPDAKRAVAVVTQTDIIRHFVKSVQSSDDCPETLLESVDPLATNEEQATPVTEAGVSDTTRTETVAGDT